MSANKVTMRLEGADLYREALTKLDMLARRRVVSAAVRAGAREIVTTARRMAPVRTGTLRRQISSSIKNDRVRGTVTATIRAKQTRADRKHGRRSAQRYAHLVIRGTKPHQIPKAPDPNVSILVNGQPYAAVRHPGARPQPFLDRAADASWRHAVRAFDFKFSERLIVEQNKLRKLPPATTK